MEMARFTCADQNDRRPSVATDLLVDTSSESLGCRRARNSHEWAIMTVADRFTAWVLCTAASADVLAARAAVRQCVYRVGQ